ncbi:MAG: hypothetical protein AAF600_01705 [Bacteroidota bacterium]
MILERENKTKIFARILAAYLLVTGVGFFFSGEFYENMVATQNLEPILVNLSGMVHFFIGAVILSFHFYWKSFLEIVVTILGVLFLLKGSALIALPRYILQTNDNNLQQPIVSGILFTVLGTLILLRSMHDKIQK